MTHNMTPELDRIVARARRNVVRLTEQPNEFAIGAVQRPGACGGAGQDRHCYKHGKRLCDMTKLGGLVQAAGATAFQLRIEPQRSSFFEPIAVRCVVTDAANSQLNYRVWFTGVEINSVPQENVSVSNPTVNTLSGWWSDDWQDPDIYAVPVNWGVFSKESQSYPLDIFGFVRGLGGGITTEISISIYGNPMDSLGPCKLGEKIPDRGSAVPIPR